MIFRSIWGDCPPPEHGWDSKLQPWDLKLEPGALGPGKSRTWDGFLVPLGTLFEHLASKMGVLWEFYFGHPPREALSGTSFGANK